MAGFSKPNTAECSVSDAEKASPEAVAQTDAIVSLEKVSVSYEKEGQTRQILKDVDFSLHPGQTIGLYGPNGTGKTTFLRCLMGLTPPQKGVVRFHGKAVRTDKEFHPLRCKVGFVFQHADDQLFFPTVLEDVAFGPLNLGMSAAEARERAKETLESLGLSGFEKRLTHHLSGGEKKMVSLATVLAMKPEALLLDEPTNDLDCSARARLIRVLNSQKTAQIIISHDRDLLLQTASEFMTIDNGKVLFTESIREQY